MADPTLSGWASTRAGWEAQAPAELNADTLKKAWHQLPPAPAADMPGLQQRFDALIGGLAQPVRKARETRPAPAQGADQPFLDKLDAMEAALQDGLLHVASEHDKTLRDTKHGRLTPAQADRLAHVRAEFKRLADWARWGGNVSREELVKAGEELPAQQLPMAELAKKVGSLRERWKSLDTLSGPAPKSLWERFDAACSVAYAPAAQHFKQLAEERHGNAAKAQELIAETAALAAEESTDWKHVASASQRLRQAWTRLGTIDRKEKKRLDAEFGAALDALSKPLDTQRQIETARREQLIVEVGLLKPSERNTVDMLKALQDKWQELAKALPLERRAEQALWQRFRAACDDIFAKRKETAHAADHERREHLHAREALCAALETAVVPEGDDKSRAAFINHLLRDTRTAWNATGPVPRASEAKIEQRYQAAVAGVQAQRTPSPNGLARPRPTPCATSCAWCSRWKRHWPMAAPTRKRGASAGAPCRRSTPNTNAACSSALPPPRPRWARAAPPTCGNCRPTRSACLMKCCAWKSSPASTAAPNLPAIA